MSSLTAFDTALAALRRDLLDPEGPRISTMRNYRFAILPYNPRDEFPVRQRVERLSDELQGLGWNVFKLSAHRLLMRRLKAQGEEVLDSWIRREERQAARNPERALRGVVERVDTLLSGQEGIAADAIAEVHRLADKYQVDTVFLPG